MSPAGLKARTLNPIPDRPEGKPLVGMVPDDVLQDRANVLLDVAGWAGPPWHDRWVEAQSERLVGLAQHKARQYRCTTSSSQDRRAPGKPCGLTEKPDTAALIGEVQVSQENDDFIPP